MPRGQLFVLHGLIETVVQDAAVIAVGEEFEFAHYWVDLVGPAPSAPPTWLADGSGPVGGAPGPVWAISVGPWLRADPYDVVLDRLETALRDLASWAKDAGSGPRVRGDQSLPLVALPVVGIGLGGHARDRGGVLTSLTARLHTLAQELGLDLALVTPEPAVYAAAQYARRGQPTSLPPDLEAHAVELGEQARRGSLALLLGAGVSVAAGLPTWGQLVASLARDEELPPVNRGAPLSPVDQAELVQKLARGAFEERIVDLVGDGLRPSLLHTMLAGLDSREVVTTNYDLLYETAVESTGREITSVMPWSSAQESDRWILKLHGDVEHPRDIVLTRRQMVTYDSTNRPSGALLQALLLTRRLLVVGTSMTDDNVLRLAHEVLQYRTTNMVEGALGVVLDAGDDLARARLWEDSLTWLPLGQEMGCDGPRAVELFLDRLTLHAARDSSWLLDERFEGLLDDPHDRHLAAEARALAAALRTAADDGSPWTPLRDLLRELGASEAL